MSDVSNLTLVSLTRKAERERKDLAKKGKKKKQLEILNEIAESKGFNTWNALRKKRLEYCQSVVTKDNSPTFYQVNDSFRSIKKLCVIFQTNFIDLLPDYIKKDIFNLQHILLALRDLHEDKNLRQESYDYSLSRYEVKPEHIIIAFFYYEKINGKDTMIEKQDEIEGFHYYIKRECRKEEFNIIKEIETDSFILSFIEGILNPPKPKMKICPNCNAENPSYALECHGCQTSFWY